MFPFLARRPMVLLMLAGLCLGCLACEQRAEPVSSPPERLEQEPAEPPAGKPGRSEAAPDARPVLVAFGDSLTAGLGVAPDETYPAQLQRRLDEAGYRYRVVNAGVSGDTTAGGVRRVDWVLRSRPQIVIVEFGGNDGLRGLDLAQTRANLQQIIRLLQAAGVTVVLAGMKLPPNYGRDYTAGFEAIYRELARTHQVTLIPFFLEGVAAQASLNQADGIHPTGEGYRVVVEHLLRTLTPLLARERAAVS